MLEFHIMGIVLMTISGWILINLVIKDIVLTTRLCLANIPPKSWLSIYSRSSSFWVVSTFLQIIKSYGWKMIFLRRLNILLPILQFVIWQGRLILGFAFFYLAIEWQNRGEIAINTLFENFLSALWLSFAVFFRLFFNNLNLEDSTAFLIANIQFYSGFLFFGFLCFYFITLRQKARQLFPCLHNLGDKFDNYYSPSILFDCLNSYNKYDLKIILDDWQQWAETLKSNLNTNPHLIFSCKSDNRKSWLAALNIILDSSAILIVNYDDYAVKRQAKRTFKAANQALVEAADLLNLLLEQNAAAENRFHQKNNKPISEYDDEILSADLIYESETSAFTTKETRTFDVMQLTYQSLLKQLSNYLDVNIPSFKR